MSHAAASAELALAGALAYLARVKGTPAEPQARQRVEAAQRAFAATQEATRVVAERQCCGHPMTWAGREWICTVGHD